MPIMLTALQVILVVQVDPMSQVFGCLHPEGLVLMYVVSQPLATASRLGSTVSIGSGLLCQAVIKELFVLPAVFFISRILISSPLNIA